MANSRGSGSGGDDRLKRIEESLSVLARNFDLLARGPGLQPEPAPTPVGPEPPQPEPTPIGPEPAPLHGIRPLERPADFKRALTRLATDVDFRADAMRQPDLILKQYKLTVRELESLREIAKLSGADISAVNRLRASEITRGIGTVADVDVSCCSCCCCCCGETSVVTVL